MASSSEVREIIILFKEGVTDASIKKVLEAFPSSDSVSVVSWRSIAKFSVVRISVSADRASDICASLLRTPGVGDAKMNRSSK